MKKTICLTLCALLVLTALCACGKKLDPASPSGVVAASLDAVKSGSSTEDSMFENAKSLAGDDDAMYNALFGRIAYTVKDERIEGDVAEVDLDVATVDISAALGAYLTEASAHAGDEDWDADGSYFISMISKKDAAKKVFAVTAHLEKQEDTWVLTKDGNAALLNAVTGGLYDYANTQLGD